MKPFVVETDIEINGIEDEVTFKVNCFDGFAIAVCDTDEKRVLRLEYPKMEDLSKEEIEEALNYRGLSSKEYSADYGDIMMRFGKIVNLVPVY